MNLDLDALIARVRVLEGGLSAALAMPSKPQPEWLPTPLADPPGTAVRDLANDLGME